MAKTCSIDRVIDSRLKQKRVEKGIEPEQLSFLLGVTEKNLLDFECGQQRIDAQIFYQICKALDIPIQYFFEPWIDKTPCTSKMNRVLTA